MMLKGEYADLLRIYEGSDGEATRGLYARLQACGPVGTARRWRRAGRGSTGASHWASALISSS